MKKRNGLIVLALILVVIMFEFAYLFVFDDSPSELPPPIIEYSRRRTFPKNPLLTNKNFYDEKYWAYQEGLGAFGGKAEAFKFHDLINHTDTLIDYGGGGGFLLSNLDAARKILIEPNPHARKNAIAKFGLEVYASPEDVPTSVVADIIITNHCLEHVPNPLEELTKLHYLLRAGGLLCIVVPVDAALGVKYFVGDINHHIYTWNALLLGNLVADAGFDVIVSEEIQYQWPPDFSSMWNRVGEAAFIKASHEYAVKNNNKQIRLVARNKGV